MRENILAKNIREGCSWEIIVFKLISCFTLSRVRGDFRDSNQNKQSVEMNLKAGEEFFLKEINFTHGTNKTES